MSSETGRYWRRIFVGNVVASAFVLFAFGGVTWHTPAGQLARNFGVALLFSWIIGPLLGFVMPLISPRIWARARFPFNWIVVSAAMALLAVAGSAAAILVLRVSGVVRGGEFGAWLLGSMRISIVVTLTIGLFITAYEVMRARVAQATAEAQLAALESRVQPHFLFNTLNSISALIHEDPTGAERMTGQLASLLRSSLDRGPAPLVSLDEELQTVRDYLSIERVRFGDRLRYTIDVPDGIGAAPIPRLALQTLVENCVKHAISPRREGGSIQVRAAAAERGFRVDVEDDGPGFDAANLPAGHGLALLRGRLALLFGERAALRINATPTGTAVSLSLPEIGGARTALPTDRNCASSG